MQTFAKPDPSGNGWVLNGTKRYITNAPHANVALIMARIFSATVMKRSEGDDEMVRIAQAVRDGAIAYLKRQYRIVFMVFVALIIFLGFLQCRSTLLHVLLQLIASLAYGILRLLAGGVIA